MPESYPFPIYSGVLEPQHYKQINSAIWLFLWCVSATTKDEKRDGVAWGIVLGGRPIKIDELSDRFGVNRSTVKRWVETLEQHDYIQTKRAPYGLIISVRNSKKFGENRQLKNELSAITVGSNMNQLEHSDSAKINHLGCKNEPSNKDIIDLKDVVITDPNEIIRRASEIEKHFLVKRGKGFSISSTDFDEVKKMVASGIPIAIVKISIDKSFAEYKPKHARDEIRNMSYCIPRCYSEWERSKVSDSITGAVPHVPVAIGTAPKQMKQKKELDDLRRRAREEREREQVRSH
ncbi:MAG: helix-turn-helix domain-containing protein [Candidatus Pristimantibacillus sp.]